MEKLDSVLAIIVQNLKETVTLMINVKKVSVVVQTNARIIIHYLIAVMV